MHLMDSAYKAEPYVGPDFDPILNAQFSPDNGFEFSHWINHSTYLIVKGKEMPVFVLAMKVVNRNGKWLVDGCGIINIPKNIQAEKKQ